MNQDDTTGRDKNLQALLRTWRMDLPLPPGFARGVWRRITASEVKVIRLKDWLAPLVQRWELALRRPAFAAAYLGAFLAIGLCLGFWRAEHYARTTEQAWRAAYVQSVSPRTPFPP